LRTSDFTADGRFLAASLRSRGAVWDLQTGHKVTLIQPFTRAWFDDGHHLYAQFPKYAGMDPVEMRISLDERNVVRLAKYDPEKDAGYQNYQYSLRRSKQDDTWSLEVKKMDGQASAWIRNFRHWHPACWWAEDNRLVLAWELKNQAGKDELKSHPALQQQAAVLHGLESGLVLEVVALDTGNLLQQAVLPEGDLTHGWRDEREVWVSGTYALVRGEHKNTAIYALDSGAKVGEFIGSPIASNAQSGIVAATNRDGEVILLDLHTGRELQRMMLNGLIRAAELVNGGRELLVLTDDQVLHRLALQLK